VTVSLRLQQSNRKEVEVLEGSARQRLAAIVGETMADNRLASAKRSAKRT
jgi:hypothetical protein